MRIVLVCKEKEVGVLETSREPRIGSRIEIEGSTENVWRIARFINPERAVVELAPIERFAPPAKTSQSEPVSQTYLIIQGSKAPQARKVGF